MEYEYNDYELIYLIQEESEEAVSIMMEKYEAIIKNVASYYVNNLPHFKLDYEELVQEGRLGLLQAIRTFNAERDTLFYTFAVLCIKGKIINYLKHSQTNKKYPLLTSSSIDLDVMREPVDKKNNPEDSFDYMEFMNNIIKFKNDLSILDAMIFELKFNSFSYKEISELLDINCKKIDNRLLSIRKKLKNYLLTC